MFVGEGLCLLVYILSTRCGGAARHTSPKGQKPFNNFLLWIPALCDMLGTSLMYLGLGLTDASVFQMLRGSVVVFTATFSVFFLKRKQYAYHWVGVALVVVGAAIVGTQGEICKPEGGSSSTTDASKAAIGNIIIVLAQIVVATQMVIEEKLISDANLPALKVVGLEGLFGFITLSILLVVMYFVPSPSFLCDPTVPGADCSHFVRDRGGGGEGGAWRPSHPHSRFRKMCSMRLQ